MKRILIALAAAGASTLVTLAATSASAEVVCNREGDCWHVDSHYRYNKTYGVVTHPDTWYFHQKWDDKHHWRDHQNGRGYYRGGVWIPF